MRRVRARFCEECGARLDPTCAACGASVPLEGKFCGQCGQPLTAAAPHTATGPAPDTYTPGHLARRILSSRQALEGERKQVTVLFADVRGSLEMLGSRPPRGRPLRRTDGAASDRGGPIRWRAPIATSMTTP
jgi:Double zinc ribbon